MGDGTNRGIEVDDHGLSSRKLSLRAILETLKGTKKEGENDLPLGEALKRLKEQQNQGKK